MSKKTVGLFTSITLLFLPVVVFALDDVNTIITKIRTTIVWPIFVGSIIIMFIYAGILFATAAGDPSKIQTAKKAVIWAVVGTVVGIAAFSMLAILKPILGVT